MSARRWILAAVCAHAALVLALCWDALLLGRVPYVRDVAFESVPDLAFLARSLAQGVWPLWNPLTDAGRPVLFAYVPDLILAGALGGRGAARAQVPLHVFIAALGATWMARERGRSPTASWATGAFFATSGYVVSCGNLFIQLHAAAWSPWVVAAALRTARVNGARPAVALAALAGLQAGSLSPELTLQTAVVALVLLPSPHAPGARRRLAAAGVLAALLAAPILAGAWAMAADSARAGGFDRGVTLSWSLRPAELPALVLPGYFGDMHTFSDTGFWGQAIFQNGFPYFLSTYLGATVLLLASFGLSRRLVLLALAGILLALGAHSGPFATLSSVALATVHGRVPAKFLLLTVLAVASMAGDGLDRARATRARAWVLAPGAAVLLVAVTLAVAPLRVVEALAGASEAFRDPRAQFVVAHGWMPDLVRTGALLLAAGLALVGGHRMSPLAAVAAIADLAVAGAALNPTAPPDFYRLRPGVAAAVEDARAQGRHRWFSYGAANSHVTWRREAAATNQDLPLFEVEVQSLLPRTQELFDLDGAFDEDRTGLAPPGASLTLDERRPQGFRAIHSRLRAANVRWVLGYDALPDDLAVIRARVRQAEVEEPLLLHELRNPLPRAFWRPLGAGGEATPSGAPVTYTRLDPHTVRLSWDTPPGEVVVLDGYHPAWRARGEAGPLDVRPAMGRYWSLATTGGPRTVTVRYEPQWRTPALTLAAMAAVAALIVIRRDRFPASPHPGRRW